MPEFPHDWIEVGTFGGQPFYVQPYEPFNPDPTPPQPIRSTPYRFEAHMPTIPTTDEIASITRLLNAGLMTEAQARAEWVLPDPINPIQQEEPPMTTLVIHDLDDPKIVVAELALPISVSYMTFTNADFRDLDLTGVSFRSCTFDNCDFSNAGLRNVDFYGSTHAGSMFHGTVLTNANFNRCTLSESEFDGANLRSARFECADLEGASFAGADLHSTYFHSASYVRDASWPGTSWSSSNRYWYTNTYGLDMCSQCAEITSSDDGCQTEDEGFVCADCGYHECYECGEYYYYIDSHNEEYHGDDDDDYCCDECSGSRGGNIRSYSYKPFWNNHGIARTKFGFELELSGPRAASAHVLESDPNEEVLICKDDSSIPNGGFEVVSHPMDLDWFNANFDHNLLPKLKEVGMRTYDTTGLHVHVSRKSFTSNFHRLTWLNLIYSNADPLTKLARRESRQWAMFNKPNKGELPAKAKEAGYQWVRYQAVNCQNDATFEMRFFRSTLNRVKLRAALEFADASVEYTRHIKSRDVLKGKALTWNHFYEWVIIKGDRYRFLQNQMEALTNDWLVDGAVANTTLNGGF